MDKLTLEELHDRQNWGYDECGFSYKQRYISALEKEIAKLKEIVDYFGRNLWRLE